MKIFILFLVLLLSFSICFAEKYNREKHFGGWVDADGDNQNTREEVLIEESFIPVKFNESGKVIRGLWFCYYTGKVTDNPKDLDIDHFIPLKEAYVSGGNKWTQEKRIDYANNLKYKNHLVAVMSGANREKGAKDISEWLPKVNIKWYLINWVDLKEKWNLCFDKNEEKVLRENNIFIYNICEDEE